MSIPASGVKVIRGNANSGLVTCLRPGDEDVKTASWNRQTIAVQCCVPGKEDERSGCRRWIGGNNDEGCFSGFSQASDGPPYITAHTYEEAVDICAANNLVLCKQSCYGMGCYYNSHPVFTNIPCDS